MDASLICDELCELDLDVQSTDEFFEKMSEMCIRDRRSIKRQSPKALNNRTS